MFDQSGPQRSLEDPCAPLYTVPRTYHAQGTQACLGIFCHVFSPNPLPGQSRRVLLMPAVFCQLRLGAG